MGVPAPTYLVAQMMRFVQGERRSTKTGLPAMGAAQQGPHGATATPSTAARGATAYVIPLVSSGLEVTFALYKFLLFYLPL